MDEITVVFCINQYFNSNTYDPRRSKLKDGQFTGPDEDINVAEGRFVHSQEQTGTLLPPPVW